MCQVLCSALTIHSPSLNVVSPLNQWDEQRCMGQGRGEQHVGRLSGEIYVLPSIISS